MTSSLQTLSAGPMKLQAVQQLAEQLNWVQVLAINFGTNKETEDAAEDTCKGPKPLGV